MCIGDSMCREREEEREAIVSIMKVTNLGGKCIKTYDWPRNVKRCIHQITKVSSKGKIVDMDIFLLQDTCIYKKIVTIRQ